MAFELEKIVRENVLRLTPYSSARREFSAEAEIWLDANENSFGSPIETDFSRYPDPLQSKIKDRLAIANGVSPDQIFVGNGSDEAIDLLFRVFCRPGIDNAVICPPTYGMYEVSAEINDVEVRRVNLTAAFDLDVSAIRSTIGDHTKLIFFCSPNNPTGNLVTSKSILEIAADFRGIVVVDEAYIHFSGAASLISSLGTTPNLVVLQTFSKAWGLAGLRVGLAFAGKEIIALLNKIKPPYNVSQIAQESILDALDHEEKVLATASEIVDERRKLETQLKELAFILAVYPSDANFVLVKTIDAPGIYAWLVKQKIVVRDRSKVLLCEGCLRITIGTPAENRTLIEALKKYEESLVH